ncbi:LysM peptidoglycan-binding domain-containing protein [Arthrobacter sp. MMS24-S77]
MGFLDGLKKNLGFDKDEQKAGRRPSDTPQTAAEASTRETAQNSGPGAASDAGAVVGSAVTTESIDAEDRSGEAPAAGLGTAVSDAAAAAKRADAEASASATASVAAEQTAAEQAPRTAAEASAGRVTEVVVETDDTLSGIAMQFGVDLDALIAVNADTVPNPDHIYPGQVLRLP